MGTQLYINVISPGDINANGQTVISFPLDSGKDFDYRARVSCRAFFHGDNERNKNGDTWYHYGTQADRDFMHELYDENPHYRDPAKDIVVQLSSLWEFYKYIGYDYKSKKYLKSSVS